MELAALTAAIFIVAVLYSSVGHGGASGYLAVMALFSSVSPQTTRPSALILNIIVSLIASISFWREGHLDFRLLLSVAIPSVPLAYIGGTINLSDEIYGLILGISLLLASFRLAWKFDRIEEIKIPNTYGLLLIGAVIGLISGLVGVGGGIFLTPLLLLMRWATAKRAAAVSAVFILVNSIAGLVGSQVDVQKLPTDVLLWLFVALLGGVIGSSMGSRKFDSLMLRRALAIVLVIAGIKLILV